MVSRSHDWPWSVDLACSPSQRLELSWNTTIPNTQSYQNGTVFLSFFLSLFIIYYLFRHPHIFFMIFPYIYIYIYTTFSHTMPHSPCHHPQNKSCLGRQRVAPLFVRAHLGTARANALLGPWRAVWSLPAGEQAPKGMAIIGNIPYFQTNPLGSTSIFHHRWLLARGVHRPVFSWSHDQWRRAETLRQVMRESWEDTRLPGGVEGLDTYHLVI